MPRVIGRGHGKKAGGKGGRQAPHATNGTIRERRKAPKRGQSPRNRSWSEAKARRGGSKRAQAEGGKAPAPGDEPGRGAWRRPRKGAGPQRGTATPTAARRQQGDGRREAADGALRRGARGGARRARGGAREQSDQSDPARGEAGRGAEPPGGRPPAIRAARQPPTEGSGAWRSGEEDAADKAVAARVTSSPARAGHRGTRAPPP